MVGVSDYLEEGELVESLLADLGDLMMEELVPEPHVVFQDNQSTMKIIQDAGGKLKSKYMKVRAAYVAERLSTREVMLEYLPTSQMIADLLTKPLGGNLFHQHAQTALGRISAVHNRGAQGKVTRKGAGISNQAASLVGMTCTPPGKVSKRQTSRDTS